MFFLQKNYYDELKEYIHYDDISGIIINNLDWSGAYEWTTKFNAYWTGYLEKYMNANSNDNYYKSCRDYTYIIVDLTNEIKDPKIYQTYKFIEETIINFTNSLCMYSYDKCSMITSEQYSNVSYKKEFDDFLEDITYSRKNLQQIHKRLHCEEINKHV
ncbi:hypothetical protein POWCR01_000218200 [Plasmodium ovale]|uniref:PIR protein n=1 Tax=Plasmodium ovale TaxID=36330 RepID=A0A1C3KKF9_PLAOA|nr:hypothetical protein POWCR01_000218200 [Plasmodium ovale]